MEEVSVTEADDGDSDFSRPEPRDVAFDSDSVFVSPIGLEADSTILIDTTEPEIFEPTATPAPVVIDSQSVVVDSESVVVDSQSNESVGKTSGSWSWFVWLGGTGLALILGLLFCGPDSRAGIRRHGTSAP